MSNWQREIECALRTMDVLLAFVAEDFEKGAWTNQEVGFALGQGKPIIVLRLDDAELGGFLASSQALRGSLARPELSADAVRSCLADVRTVRQETGELITALVEAGSFDIAVWAFRRLDEFALDLNESEVQRILEGFAANDSLHNSYILKRAKELPRFLDRTAALSASIQGNEIRLRT